MLPDNWYEGCLEQVTKRMRDRRSYTRPHAGLLGPPFRDVVNEQEDDSNEEEDLISTNRNELPQERPIFTQVPNVYLLEFNIQGKEKIELFLNYYYRKRDGSHIAPRGIDETGCPYEDDRYFQKVKIKAVFNTVTKQFVSAKYFEDETETELPITNQENRDRVFSRIIITHESESFIRRNQTTSNNYLYQIYIDINSAFKEDNLNMIVRIENDSPERLITNHLRDSQNNFLYSYTYGFLYEVEGEIRLANNQIIRNPINLNYFERLNNVATEFGTQNNILFKDSKILTENIKKLKWGASPRTFLSEFNKSEYNGRKRKHLFDTLLGDCIEQPAPSGLGFSRLRKFQELSIKKIMASFEESDMGKVVPSVITAQTAAGKTEAFMIPALQHCIEENKQNLNGTNTLIFYPTIALANDQANRISKMLYFINKKLDKPITIGVLHGHINYNHPDEDYLIFTCPLCGKKLKFRNDGDEDVLCCDDHQDVKLDFLRLTRNEIYSQPPSILITTPDMANYLLLNKPETHSIFGRNIKYCKECLTTYANLRKRKCDNCASEDKETELIETSIRTSPKVMIFDEIHLLKGGLGSHVAFLIDRLRAVISHYLQLINPQIRYTPVLIGSTATIKKPKEFCKEFFGADECFLTPEDDEITEVIEDEIDESTIKRIHHFSFPLSWKPIPYTIKAIERFYEWWQTKEWYIRDNIKPNILIFVNSIKNANELISSLNIPGLQIGGHNTDFDKKARVKAEKDFNKGILNILVATRTLEVGVDFDNIHALFIYGAPYSYNDYLQRIGRAGRKYHSVVFNIFNPYIPVDSYYFSNCDYLIREEYRQHNLEAIPIKRHNIRIMEKMHMSAILDSILLRDNAHQITNESINLLASIISPTNIREKEERKRYCSDTLGEYFDENIFEREYFNLVNALPNSQSYSIYFNKLCEHFFITNMRYADKDIPLELPRIIGEDNRDYLEQGESFSRSRPLGYSIKKLFPEAAVSFRGFTFQVTDVTTADVLPRMDNDLYNQLHRRVNRNYRLRRHAFLHPDRNQISIHVPNKIIINWNNFKDLACKRCGHLQQADSQGVTCLNCGRRMVTAPVIIDIPPRNNIAQEAKYITIANRMITRQRFCHQHGMVFHLLSDNMEDPIGSLKWVCPHCRPDKIGGTCEICNRLMEGRSRQ